MVYGGGTLHIIELTAGASAIKAGGVDQVLIDDASAPAAPVNLKAEGSHLEKINGKYYLFNITWPRDGMRTELVHRADTLLGPYEGRICFQDKGVAQGSVIDTPDGKWYAYLFRDSGAVGRLPWIVPATWQNGWPVIGVDGKAPETLDELPANKSPIPGIVASDEFDRKPSDPALPLVWQWNHNPVEKLWSVTARPGFLRLTTDRTDPGIFSARNTLTQRTFGPECSGATSIDVTNMKDGDIAGLSIFQAAYGLVGVKMEDGKKSILMGGGKDTVPEEYETVSLDPSQNTVYLKADCDYKDKADTAYFYYSLDGKTWVSIGKPVKLVYSLAHFVGNRFALFNYSTKSPGGFVDFDFFHVGDQIGARALQ
jgi:beta-xylosidase